MSNITIRGTANVYVWSEDNASWRFLGRTVDNANEDTFAILPIAKDFGGERVIPNFDEPVPDGEWREFVESAGLT